MAKTFICPQGHEWQADSSPQAATLQAQIACPVCGAVVSIAPSKKPGETEVMASENLPAVQARQLSDDHSEQARRLSHADDDTFGPGGAAPAREKVVLATRHPHQEEDEDSEGPEVPGYYILRELGRGGMGVVYLAHQEGLDRFVALKMILGDTDVSAEDLKRFKMEAVAISRLQHPNLVHIYQVSEHEGRPFFSMEFVDGGNLDDKFAGKPMAPREAAKIIAQLAHAVHYAHTKGIIHRDLKPGNVLLTTEGTPKITDFGLAKRMDSGIKAPSSGGVPTAQPRPEGGTGMTMAGSIMGTPSYMAPEQASGRSKDIGPHTDTYALGSMLYELLTGRPPFMAETGWDTIVQVVEKEPLPPSHLQPYLPRDLETIALKCLEKDYRKRYESAEALAEDLERYLRHEPILARPTGRIERFVKWVLRRPAFAGMIAVILVAAAFLVSMGVVYHLRLQRLAEESHVRNVRLSVAGGARLLDEGDWFGALVWFSEALRLEENKPAHEEVHRQRIASVFRQCPHVVQLWFHDGAVRHASFSPDGRFVVTAGEDQAANIWNVATGEQVGAPLEHLGIVWQAWFSPDGTRVLTGSGDGTARIWDARTGKPLSEPLHHGASVTTTSFSPDGHRVLTAGGDTKVMLWDIKTALATPLRHGGQVNHAEFSRDGRRIVSACDDRRAYLWNTGNAKQLSTLDHGDAVLFAGFSPDGQIVATTSKDQSARLWDVDKDGAGRLRATLPHNDLVKWAAFSPDGQRLVTASDDDTVKLWKVNTGEMLAAPMKHGSNVRRYVTFSPDGAWIVTSSDDNSGRLWDGYSGEPFTTNLVHNGTVHCAAFSPNGHHLITVSDDNVACLWDLATQSLLNGTPQRRTPPAESKRLEIVSPDQQRKLVVTGNRVSVRDANDRELFPVLKHKKEVKSACFSADSRWIATASADQTAMVWSADSGKPRCPPLRHASYVAKIAFDPVNGQRVVTGSGDNTARIWNADTGAMLTPPLQHSGSVLDVAFSADGKRVATASVDQTARVWGSAMGGPITPMLPHDREVIEVSFSSDGQRLTTVSANQMVRTWELPSDERPAVDLMEIAQLIAGSRIDEQGRHMPIEVERVQALWKKWKGVYPEVTLSSVEVIRDWQKRRAEFYVLEKRWTAALWNLDRLIAAEPSTGRYWRLRGQVHSELGDKDRAAADLAQAAKLGDTGEPKPKP